MPTSSGQYKYETNQQTGRGARGCEEPIGHSGRQGKRRVPGSQPSDCQRVARRGNGGQKTGERGGSRARTASRRRSGSETPPTPAQKLGERPGGRAGTASEGRRHRGSRLRSDHTGKGGSQLPTRRGEKGGRQRKHSERQRGWHSSARASTGAQALQHTAGGSPMA